MATRNFKIFAIAFSSFFVVIIVLDKFFGYTDRFSTAYYEPLSWNEIFSNIPSLIIASIVVGLFSTVLYNEAKKVEAKNMENARKRIEEKERKEKGSKSDNQEIK
jgi:uncharacterized membrane protein (DUF106 family)